MTKVTKQTVELCKRRAKQIKSDHPGVGYCKRLDIAAHEFGFERFTEMQKAVAEENQ